uniref:Uncharacterized protein n=1 Tax=Lactuca sativa TaxID=4236 RepID=A0A9R1WFV4_LACSA|nr:hypothetical protein LSAT_V11C200059980 [Lactuca sativa]
MDCKLSWNIFRNKWYKTLKWKKKFLLIVSLKDNFSTIPTNQKSWQGREKLVTKFRLMRQFYLCKRTKQESHMSQMYDTKLYELGQCYELSF